MSEDNLWRSLFQNDEEKLDQLFKFFVVTVQNNTDPRTDIELEVRFHRRAGGRLIPGISSNAFEKTLSRLPPKTAEISTVFYYANQIRKVNTADTSVVQGKQPLASVDVNGLDLRFSLAKEINYDPSITQGHIPNFTRQRQRYSYRVPEVLGADFPVLPGCEQVRIDLTRVTSASQGNNAPQDQYEIEIECPLKTAIDPKILKNNFLTILLGLYKFVNDTELLYLPSRKQAINQQMLKIFADVNTTGKDTFQPWWLVQTRNIKKQDIVYGGIVGGAKEYCVTHKADGVRKLLMIAGSEVWLIMPPGEFNYLGKLNGVNIMALFDGEYIHRDLNGDKRYYIFDTIIYFDGKDNKADKRYLQNYLERLSFAEQLFANEIIVSKVKIAVKPVYRLPDRETFFRVMRQMFAEKAQLAYNTDGLVFTPINEKYDPGNSKINNHDRVLTDYSDIVKWKPSSHITADFLVKIEGNFNGRPILGLYYTDPASRGGPIRFTGSKRHPFDSMVDIEENEVYRQIGTNNIVEFGYNYEIKKLYPTRIRYDKSGPNRKAVIDNVWKDIHDPITAEYLMGLESQLIFSCHNEIKKQILQQYVIGGKILDIGSGRGGDLGKWEHLQDPRVLCIEPNPDNIMEFIRRLRSKPEAFQKRIFLVETGGEDTETITKNVELYFNGSTNSVTMMLSLSFFWKDQEMLDRLVATIVKNTTVGSKFVFLTVDDVYLQPGFHDTIVGTFDVQQKLPGQFSNTVKVNFPDTIVGEQTEYLVHLPDLYQRLARYGFELIKSDRIDHDVLLSDEQLLYSRLYSWSVLQRTQSEAIPTTPLENLVAKATGTIKENLTLPTLEDDVSQEIPCHFANDIYRIGCIGDGSCLIHTFLKSVYPTYQQANHDERILISNEMRLQLAKLLQTENPYYPGYSWWETVGNGIFVELALQQLKVNGTVDFNNINWSLPGLQRLLNSKAYLGDEIFSLISAVFDIDIYLFQAVLENDRPTLSRQAVYTYTKPHSRSISVLWVNKNHFELLALRRNGLLQTSFENQDPWVATMKTIEPLSLETAVAFNPSSRYVKIIAELMADDVNDGFLDQIQREIGGIFAQRVLHSKPQILALRAELLAAKVKSQIDPAQES